MPLPHFKSPAKIITSLLRYYSKRQLPIIVALSIHAHTIKTNNITSDPFSYNLIISSLVNSGQLKNARKLFVEMPKRNIITYTAMIDAHMKSGLVEEAMDFFARSPFHSVVSYTATINGLVRNGLKFEALSLFRKMIGNGLMPNEMAFTTVLSACVISGYDPIMKCIVGLIVKTNFEKHTSVCNSLITTLSRIGEVGLAKRVFDNMSERDVVSWTAILDVYFLVGDTTEACRMFDSMPKRNEISWSTMITRLSQNDEPIEALRFFDHMIRDGYKPNISCFASVLSASASCSSLLFGSNVHCLVVKFGLETDCYVASSLIDMYSKCRESPDARRVFNLVLDKNIVVWNSILGGYGYDGRVEEAEEIFEQMPNKDIASWNAMISGYDLNHQYEKALDTFNELLNSGLMPIGMSFSSILHSCANLPSLEKGRNLHAKTVKIRLDKEVIVATALLDMYSKSGDIESAKRIFCTMPEKNEISWTVMIQGLSDCGLAKESIDLFEKMKQTNIIPTETMFLCVLFTCSHCGLVDRGFHYFKSMEKEYGISPNEWHYTCMVDLLSRAGHLRAAEKFIRKMPFKPEANSWVALLRGCCTNRNVEIGERAAKKILESGNSSTGYVLLSNLYASVGNWKKAGEVRKLMKEAGVKKEGGYSWIQIRDRPHLFYSWDANHVESLQIYGVLELLMSELVKY